jgi:CrcB protein
LDSLTQLALVGAGGFLGAIARYSLSGLAYRSGSFAGFPYATLLVNVVGCLAIGLLAGLAEHRFVLGTNARLFLMIGFLGGFTTFSTFGYETMMLVRDTEWFKAMLNAVLHLVLGVVAVWIGLAFSRLA